jgi:hypothetical protein
MIFTCLVLLLLPHRVCTHTAGGPVDDESASKRPRLDFVLTAEDEFLAEHGEGPSKVGGGVALLCAVKPRVSV